MTSVDQSHNSTGTGSGLSGQPLAKESRIATPSAVRPAMPEDVSGMVDIHLSSFSGFFLSYLGPAFLLELYEGTLQDPSGIGYVMDSERSLIGFVCGTAQPVGFYSRLLKNRWWRFALASIGPALKRPIIVPRLFRAFAMPSRATRQEERGTLMSIAVRPEAQGQGHGRTLVMAFLDEARRRGLRHVDLSTDRDDNEAANRFYQSLGFVCTYTYLTPEGRAMNEYVIDLRMIRSNLVSRLAPEGNDSA